MARLRILLVDDDRHICILGRELLERLGYEVETAGGGEEVLARFRRDDFPDLVILDYNLPGMSGLEVLKFLKACHPGIKVLMTSGFFSRQEMEQLKVAGASGFLSKPFRSRAVKSLIEEILGKSPSS